MHQKSSRNYRCQRIQYLNGLEGAEILLYLLNCISNQIQEKIL